MILPDLLNKLPALREIFPTPIIQEWSVEEYQAGMRALERHLLAALERWRAKVGVESTFVDSDDFCFMKNHDDNDNPYPMGDSDYDSEDCYGQPYDWSLARQNSQPVSAVTFPPDPLYDYQRTTKKISDPADTANRA
jgi:hypothetical protein